MVIKQVHNVIVVCLARSDSGEVPGRNALAPRLGLSHTSLRAFPFPTTYLNLAIHIRKAGPSFHQAQNTLCLCMKAFLAHSVLSRQLKQALSREWAGSLCRHSWKAFKGSEDSQLTGSQPCPFPECRQVGEHGEPIESIRKTKCDPSHMSLKCLDALSVTVVRNQLRSKELPLG